MHGCSRLHFVVVVRWGGAGANSVWRLCDDVPFAGSKRCNSSNNSKRQHKPPQLTYTSRQANPIIIIHRSQQQFGLQQQAFAQQQQQQQQQQAQQPSAHQLLNHLFPPHLAQDQRQSCLHLSAAVFPPNGNNSTNPEENAVLAQLMNLAKNQQLTSQQMQILKAVIGLRNGEWRAGRAGPSGGCGCGGTGG